MKLLYIITALFVTTLLIAQERINTGNIYTTKGISYKKSDNSPFTGVAEFRKNNGNLMFEKEYNNGFITKYTLYFRGDEKIISNETFYHEKSNTKKKNISYPYNGTLKTITDYDENGKKLLEEQYISDKLVFHCEYINGKKHGVVYSTDKNNIKSTCTYNDGKRISSTKETVNVR